MLMLKDISKHYDDKIVLKNISADFYSGESTVIVGESGGGKTTLAKIIVGMEIMNKGEVIFDNKILPKLRYRTFEDCRNIQYIFQDPYSAFEPNFTVEQTLLEVKRISKRNGFSPLDYEEALAMVDEKLISYMKEKVSILSGGQRQKLSIARSLMIKPRVIIADEITSMLDTENRADIDDLLVKLTKENSLILLYIAHEIDLENGKWDNIIVLNKGKILDEGNFSNFEKWCKSEYSKELVKAYKYFEND